jgi:VWFA-related protein
MVVTTQVQEPVFRAGNRTVPIYATVTGPDGRLIPNLVRDDFTVLDDGQPRPITVFSNQPTAIVGLAMWDVSPALDKNHLRARTAARALVDALWADDRLRFGTFSGQEFALSPLLTGDKAVLRRVVDEEIWFSDYGSPIWSALDHLLTLASREQGRRVLVVLSAGRSTIDPGSKNGVLRKTQQTDCMVYVIGLEGSGLTRDVQEVAAASGGGYVELRTSSSLDAEFVGIMTELHQQYLIGIAPDRTDGSLHTLTVKTRIVGAKVRARQAYIADRPAAVQ